MGLCLLFLIFSRVKLASSPTDHPKKKIFPAETKQNGGNEWAGPPSNGDIKF